jgi:hypothetical protein
MISSMDDFYILDSGLVVTETSNDIFDQSLYRKVVPQAALSWQRVLMANWLSKDGADWAHWVAQHNSGTFLKGCGVTRCCCAQAVAGCIHQKLYACRQRCLQLRHQYEHWY